MFYAPHTRAAAAAAGGRVAPATVAPVAPVPHAPARATARAVAATAAAAGAAGAGAGAGAGPAAAGAATGAAPALSGPCSSSCGSTAAIGAARPSAATSSTATSSHRSRPAATAAAAAASSSSSAAPAASPAEGRELKYTMPTHMAPDAAAAISYAIQFAFTAETYEVHSWMILLALLREEKGVSAQALADLGLTDPYGAWHEVLWALNAAEGLVPRGFTARMHWARRARRVADGSLRFAAMAGRSKVRAHDLLLALAASEAVLPALFPDLDMSFASVRRAVEKRAGEKYVLPEELEGGGPLDSKDDIFA